MMKGAAQIIKNINAGQYAPVYFLQGEEPHYIDLISELIEKNALDEEAKGFNQIILYGKDVKVNDVLGNARRFPMMSERQVVIVKEAQNIEDISMEEGAKYLMQYLENPLPSTILVLCYKHKSWTSARHYGSRSRNTPSPSPPASFTTIRCLTGSGPISEKSSSRLRTKRCLCYPNILAITWSGWPMKLTRC
jgi:hypothetical protein